MSDSPSEEPRQPGTSLGELGSGGLRGAWRIRQCCWLRTGFEGKDVPAGDKVIFWRSLQL